MSESVILPIPVRELLPHERHRPDGHSMLCHGESPMPLERVHWLRSNERSQWNEPMRFHLGISQGGERLFLFRQGYLPQELVISDLISAWLLALHVSSDHGLEESEDAPVDAPDA